MPALAYSIFSSVISLIIVLVLIQVFIWWNTPSNDIRYTPSKGPGRAGDKGTKGEDYYDDISQEVAKVSKNTTVDGVRGLYEARENTRADCSQASCFLHAGYLSQPQCLSEAERIDDEIQSWNYKHRDYKPGVGYVSWKAGGPKTKRPQCLILGEDATMKTGQNNWTTFTKASYEESVPRL